MTDASDLIVGGRPPRDPFRAEDLPLIARLAQIGFHRYRRRWAKRLFKRPGRMLFDVAYHGLGLGGRGAVSVDLPGGRARLDFDARKVHFRGIYDGPVDSYEPEVAAILETLLAGERVFYDVGANWGYFTLYAAGIPGYTGAVHAFEPIADTFADLDDLARQAGLAGRVHCHPIALSDRDGEATMAFDPIDTGIARLAAAGQGGAGGGRRVRLARLDGLGLPAPWLMKVDVETHEAQVFRGAAAMIAGARPFIVFENWIARGDPQATLRPLRTLEEMGYALYRPCWEFNDGKETFVWPESTPPRPCPRRRLALVRFAAEARFQFGEQINAFACHRDRVAELKRVFSGGGPETDLG
ncbi:MAG TPA: FkbM family methyltransferase [Rhodospirillales bacterium]